LILAVISVKNSLRIINARENNLKGLNLTLPHQALIGVTGLSGSGKSSLAFDTIYAEGQRRYIETFSPYTRQFFDKVKRPKVDLIENVRPAIAIQQRTRILNSRSTVGSMTDINDLLKILWSNVAQPVCPTCGFDLIKWDASSLTRHIEIVCTLKPDATFLIGVQATNSKEQIERLQILGYSRYVHPNTGALVLFEDSSPPKKVRQLTVVIDRCRHGSFSAKQVRDSLEQCFSAGDGTVQIIEQRSRNYRPFVRLTVTNEQRVVHKAFETYSFSQNYQCGDGSVSVSRPRPALFSYNHPIGACSECNGFGKILVIDPNRCVPDHGKSIKEHAVECWKGNAASGEHKQLLTFCKQQGIPIDRPWGQLSSEQQQEIFTNKSRSFVGIYPWFSWLERKKYKMHVRVFLARYRGQVDCPSCGGTRFKNDALAYRIQGASIAGIATLPLEKLLPWFRSLHSELVRSGKLPRQLDDVLTSIINRLHYLVTLGLPYLTLDRQARTLSGGETQRVNLVSALGSNLISTHFVLDEPSVGLHARDTEALIGALRDLTDRGNSLTVVEHDPECLDRSDYILELGPQAGERGGEVTFMGPRDSWAGLDIAPYTLNSVTPSFDQVLAIRKACNRNLKSLDVDIPLNAFVALTGVSGSGKSSLITEVIQAAFEIHRGVVPGESALDAQVHGFEHLSQVLMVDQSPLSKTPRANIATYTKIWDRIRDLLAGTDEAIARGLSRSSFSFNVSAGRCATCEGAGFIREDMQFLSDVFIECEACLGMRFQAPVLEVQYKGHNVHQILSMSVEACKNLFEHEKQIASACQVLMQLGLGHITLGHPLSELSGGEAQRLKLVPHIVDGARGRSLFLFDEPTTGLHVKDVERLIELFRFLCNQGHSIVCVEHNLRLIASADWIIDLGPEGGERGGYLVEQGTPHDIASRSLTGDNASSLTGSFLARSVGLVGEKGRHLQKRTSPEPSVKRKAPKSANPAEASHISIRGAREHNLKSISLDVPLGSLITLTGVSGSGKSTIAKDIIYAEGQRRYLDCLSPYARQFIKELKKPAIDDIQNVQPTICVYQHTFQPSALSTVATMSEVYNFLRLLFAKVGTQFCPDHPEQSVSPLSAEQIASYIKRNYQGSIRLLAPVINQKKGHHKAVFQRALETEMSEVRVDGVFSAPGRFVTDGLAKTKSHSIEFVTTRCTVRSLPIDLLIEGVKQALAVGGGTVIVNDSRIDRVFSSQRTCQICQRGFFKPDPEDLSFNSRRGRCPRCDGYGILKNKPCPECGGSRLHEIGRNIRLFDQSIDQLCSLSAPALLERLAPLLDEPSMREIAQPIIQELSGKLRTLTALGLEHLALNRECATLSNGELQRLRLATAIGSPLTGVTYIFDEPSAGLHPADNRKLLSTLTSLRDRGNTVIQIEHEIDNILHSDQIIDVGPAAGTHGGEIVFQGPVSQIRSHPLSATSRALTEPLSFRSDSKNESPQLAIRNASRNNLKKLTCEIPLQSLVTIAGVSGAGKSSLVHGVIVDALSSADAKDGTYTTPFGTVSSGLPIDRILVVDQQPIGKTSRSTPASYLGVWDDVRAIFASTLEAKSRGWGPSFFSHNTGKGRCPTCKGNGELTLEMSFLAEAKVPCESCGGSRFTLEADSIRYRDLSVSQVLNLTFEEARTIFVNHRKIHQMCAITCELGLGYLTLGQPSSTLSGGESQRLKLASELHLARRGHTLYVLDEPTTGLHRIDVALLLKALHGLKAQGHSVLVIEHDADTIAQSDWVIELGPGPGDAGGRVIYSGQPRALEKAKTPWGVALRERIALHSKMVQAPNPHIS
jgi:excinuclease ABC subunit A